MPRVPTALSSKLKTVKRGAAAKVSRQILKGREALFGAQGRDDIVEFQGGDRGEDGVKDGLQLLQAFQLPGAAAQIERQRIVVIAVAVVIPGSRRRRRVTELRQKALGNLGRFFHRHNVAGSARA